jgi:hypothetical protein
MHESSLPCVLMKNLKLIFATFRDPFSDLDYFKFASCIISKVRSVVIYLFVSQTGFLGNLLFISIQNFAHLASFVH